MSIREYILKSDSASLHRLWNDSVGEKWRLPIAKLKGKLAIPKPNYRVALVNEEGGKLVGFCAAGYSRASKCGGILAILVDPRCQRRGVGRALLTRTMALLAEGGIKKMTLGSGGPNGYFWSGVPFDLPSAWPIFTAHGWREREKCVDLVQALLTYGTPSWVYDRIQAKGIVLELATAQERDRIIGFESVHFPNWADFFASAVALSGNSAVLLAKSSDGSIAGSVLLGNSEAVCWNEELGGQCGSFGALGVSEQMRDAGIGLALAARATEILKARRNNACYVGWTGLADWYGKLGYKIWAEYPMAELLTGH